MTTQNTKEDKKVVRQAKRAARKQQFSQIGQAIRMQRQEDPKALLIIVGAFLACILIGCLIGILSDMFWIFLILSILVGILVALIIFSRRARSLAYSRADGQIGAAAWVLDNLRGSWRVKTGVNASSQFDVIHRVLGLPGIIIVGEGNEHKVKQLISQEKRNLSKLAGTAPIYEVIIGNEAGQTPLPKLDSFLRKLPKNINRNELDALDRRLIAIKPKTQIPKGPLPQGAKIRGVNRAMKRR